MQPDNFDLIKFKMADFRSLFILTYLTSGMLNHIQNGDV